jgi:hypothetical protein
MLKLPLESFKKKRCGQHAARAAGAFDQMPIRTGANLSEWPMLLAEMYQAATLSQGLGFGVGAARARDQLLAPWRRISARQISEAFAGLAPVYFTCGISADLRLKRSDH